MQMLWEFYELLAMSIFLVLMIPITLPCFAGAIPGFIERRRRRQLAGGGREPHGRGASGRHGGLA